MAFTPEPTRAPTAIGAISIDLYSPDPTSDEVAGANYSVQIRMDDGSIVVRTGDLVPHITQTQINGLLSFMDTLRVKAIAEFLP